MKQVLFPKPILVTGIHRSGTTWVGRMIATSPAVGYIHEPFNIAHRPGICGARFEHWYTYICDANSSAYFADLRNCLQFQYQFAKELKEIKTPLDAARLIRDGSYFLYCRSLKKRPLIKDPLAFFSAEWLAKTFNMDVVIMIRHPAAFASSLKIANRPHPFLHFLQQPLLMHEYLSEFKSEIKKFTENKNDIIDQAILLWNIIHTVILKYKKNHPEWIYIRHNDISDDPISKFSYVFDRLDLTFSQPVQQTIMKFSHPNNLSGQNNLGSIKRDSKTIARNWTKRLSDEEIHRIREGTKAVSCHFFSDAEWSQETAEQTPLTA